MLEEPGPRGSIMGDRRPLVGSAVLSCGHREMSGTQNRSIRNKKHGVTYSPRVTLQEAEWSSSLGSWDLGGDRAGNPAS